MNLFKLVSLIIKLRLFFVQKSKSAEEGDLNENQLVSNLLKLNFELNFI